MSECIRKNFSGHFITTIGEFKVDSWYDRGSKWGWITTIQDSEGNQLGLASYGWKKVDAEIDHDYYVQKVRRELI